LIQAFTAAEESKAVAHAAASAGNIEPLSK
jgi:hypothetical protein